MANKKKTAVLIVAAGEGLRAKTTTPKQYLKICGKSILEHTIANFIKVSRVDFILVVINEKHFKLYKKSTSKIDSKKLLPSCLGGSTRSESVKKGLFNLVNYKIDKVLIHDAARPFASKQLIESCIAGLDNYDVVLPGINVTDTLWEKSMAKSEPMFVTDKGPNRDNLIKAQTPQAFNFNYIFEKHKNNKESLPDDVYLAFQESKKINIIEGCIRNFKITTPNDISLAKELIRNV
tara:strand:- start:645 stop:1349 length:705 start_codon:yes stop_codon:yes gene_type:complete